jgi:two-component system response regulator MprA
VRPRLLIVEDDPDLRDVLVRSLTAEGFNVTAVASGHRFLAAAVDDPADVLVIDIGLPDADGRDVCQALRARGINSPVLFLTARDALPDRLSGFSAGGDDYIIKPFDIEELGARLHALLRRAGGSREYQTGGLVFDPTEHSVRNPSGRQALSPTEFRLLAALSARPEEAVSRRELVAAAWPHGAIVHDNTLDVYVARLRRKLRELDGAPRIVTVHGVGYRVQ